MNIFNRKEKEIMLSFILSMFWLFGGLFSVIYFRISDYFSYINNWELYFIINVIVGLPIAMLSWVGLLLAYLFNKITHRKINYV